MNPEDRAVEEIRALLGPAPEVAVPRGLEERVRAGGPGLVPAVERRGGDPTAVARAGSPRG